MIFQKIRENGSAPKLVLIGNFGAGNFGDELILSGFLRKIGRELPKAKVVVLAAEPKLIRRFHGVDALPQLPTGPTSFLKLNWWRSLRAVRNCDAVIFPGGGLFADDENPLAVWIWGLPILIARYFWRPVFLLGQSVGPFTESWTRKFTKFCLAKTEWVGVRDAASENELRRICVPGRKIRVGRDSAFWLVNQAPKIRERRKRGLLRILVSVRDFPQIEKEFWMEFTRALDALAAKKHVRISFAEFGRDDAAIWKKLKRRAKNSAGWKTLELPESAEQILKELRKFDLVIGLRLHSLIAARLAGTPAIGFAYSRKISEFAENSLAIKNFKKEQLLKILN
ncbi:MAG: polysaccharide pyruvyl transferase family protein [Patescibacteria group bacterium]